MLQKIVFFLNSLQGGGSERVMVTLANYFARKGHTVSMVLIFPVHTLVAELLPDVKVIDLHASRVSAGGLRFARYLRQANPDAILSTITRINGWAVLAHRLSRCHACLLLREATTPSIVLRQLSTRKERLDYEIIRYLYPLADAIVVPSRGVWHDVMQIAPHLRSLLSVIYNPVIDSRLYSLSLEPVEHPWFANPQTPIVLAVGRLVWDKGFDVLIRAFAVVRECMNARLVILGEGEERPALERLIHQLNLQEWVWMPGFEQNPFKYMRRASVFVLSSRREGLPNSLIEAMACGCPVVSTSCPSGPDEILEGGKYGELVPVEDADALAQAILKVLRAGSKSIPDEWLQQFHVDYVGDQYMKLLFERM